MSWVAYTPPVRDSSRTAGTTPPQFHVSKNIKKTKKNIHILGQCLIFKFD